MGLQDDKIMCDRMFCNKVVKADEACWDRHFELAFCSQNHLQESDEFRDALRAIDNLTKPTKSLDGMRAVR